MNGSNLAGLAGMGIVPGQCGTVGTAVAGLTATGLNGLCFGPSTFVQRLASLRGIPVVLCLENGRCVVGEIIQVCVDYLEFNCNGTLVEIPLKQITRVQLASSHVSQ